MKRIRRAEHVIDPLPRPLPANSTATNRFPVPMTSHTGVEIIVLFAREQPPIPVAVSQTAPVAELQAERLG